MKDGQLVPTPMYYKPTCLHQNLHSSHTWILFEGLGRHRLYYRASHPSRELLRCPLAVTKAVPCGGLPQRRRPGTRSRVQIGQFPVASPIETLLTSSPQSKASRSFPFARFHIASSCYMSRMSRLEKVGHRGKCLCTSMPQALTWSAVFLASGHAKGVPTALEGIPLA